MGKLLPDLDLRISHLQSSYERNYTDDEYRKAANFLWQLNWTLPPNARLTDMVKPGVAQDDFYEDLTGEEQYRDYCDKWAPMVMGAIALYNEEMLNAYAKATGMR